MWQLNWRAVVSSVTGQTVVAELSTWRCHADFSGSLGSSSSSSSDDWRWRGLSSLPGVMSVMNIQSPWVLCNPRSSDELALDRDVSGTHVAAAPRCPLTGPAGRPGTSLSTPPARNVCLPPSLLKMCVVLKGS